MNLQQSCILDLYVISTVLENHKFIVENDTSHLFVRESAVGVTFAHVLLASYTASKSLIRRRSTFL
jgi:hypothetical protein